ncbi:MAG: phosphatase PAP2 family protein [Kofleriaceae bacterium]
MAVRLMAIGILCLAAVPAHADKDPVPWYRGTYGRNRITHLSVTVALGAAYLASETVFNDALTTPNCRWCDPPGIDRRVRDGLVWKDPDRANLLSNVDAYVVAPIVGLGLLILSDHDASPSRIIDDLLPIAETVAISQIVTQIVKFSVARQRPYARFGTDFTVSNEDNLSFWSGHSALGFGITTSAGLIAHWRGYWTEPYIWGAGIAISLSTEYLRIAADKHYLSDVLVGGLVGVGSGLLIPRLMRRDLRLAPAPSGAAIVGTF